MNGRSKLRNCEYFAKHGKPEFLDRAIALEAEISEFKAEGGRFWQQDEFTVGQIERREQEIANIEEYLAERMAAKL